MQAKRVKGVKSNVYQLGGFYFQFVRLNFISNLLLMLELRLEHDNDGKLTDHGEVWSIRTQTLYFPRCRLMSRMSKAHCHPWVLESFLVLNTYSQEGFQLKSNQSIINRWHKKNQELNILLHLIPSNVHGNKVKLRIGIFLKRLLK